MNATLASIGWLDLVSTIVLAGGIVYCALVGPPSAAGRRAIRGAAGVVAVALLLELVVTALRLKTVSSASGLQFATELLATHWGWLWIVRCIGLGVLVACTRFGARVPAVVAALWLLPRSLQGHAGAHGTVPALIDWIHLLAATSWLGGLAQFTLLPAASARAAAERVRRLSTVALAALVPAGLYAALLHIPSLGRLFTSPYGRTLLAKLAVAAVLIGFGAVNHFVSVPALRRHGSRAEIHLRRIVRLEVVLGAVVVGLSALLGVLPLPHAIP